MSRVLYFGPAEIQLLGVFHPSTERVQRSEGILLCYPGPQEYMRIHWAMRRLAGMLSQRGFPTFRFDYHGTGDSAGDSAAGTLARWQQDIALAHEELIALGQVRQVSIVGFRLGATLAARAVNAGLAVKSLALWDPVVSGSSYLAELMAQEDLERAWSLCPGPRHATELLGHHLSESERRATKDIDLPTVTLKAAVQRLGLFHTSAHTDFDHLSSAWTAQGLDHTRRQVTEDGPPRRRGMIMANKALADLASWLEAEPT